MNWVIASLIAMIGGALYTFFLTLSSDNYESSAIVSVVLIATGLWFYFKDLPSGLWSDFLVSMLTLFRVLTFEDWTDVMYEAMEVYPSAWLYFVSFIIIAAFVFFNLFVAVIIGEMQKLQDEELKDYIH